MHVYMTTQRDLTNQNLWTQGISRILSILYKCLFLHYLDQVFFYPLTLWKLLLALQTSQQMQHPSQTNKNRQTKGIKQFFLHMFAHVVVQVFFCPWTLEFKASISNAIQIYILQVFRGLYLKCKHVSYTYILLLPSRTTQIKCKACSCRNNIGND